MPKTGKSTLLLSTLKPYRHWLGGFYVQRRIKDGICAAYALCAVEDGSFEPNAPYVEGSPNAFLTLCERERILDLSVFDVYGSKVLRRSRDKALVLLDEIGGIDLLSDTFFYELRALLISDTPCIGVFKSEEAQLRMRRDVKRAQESEARRQLLRDLLQSDATLITDTTDNGTKSAVEAFLKPIFDTKRGGMHVGLV